MNVSDIIINSIKYPLDNTEDLMNTVVLYGILAVAFVVFLLFMGLAGFFDSSTSRSITLIGLVISMLIVLVFSLIKPGYMLSVVDEGINQSDVIPSINIGKNIVDTIKLAILSFVYSIIPAIIAVAVIVIAGVIGTVPTMGFSSMGAVTSPAFILTMLSSFGFAALILAVIYAFFYLLFTVGALRMVNFDSLGAGLSFGETWADLKDIGILKIFLVFISVCAVAFLFISALVSVITYTLALGIVTFNILLLMLAIIAALLLILLVFPVVNLCLHYALGLLYSEIA